MKTRRSGEGRVVSGEKNKKRACRRCGCTYFRACVDKWGTPCHWVEQDLCSACVGIPRPGLTYVAMREGHPWHACEVTIISRRQGMYRCGLVTPALHALAMGTGSRLKVQTFTEKELR